jgi:hypothetical protein
MVATTLPRTLRLAAEWVDTELSRLDCGKMIRQIIAEARILWYCGNPGASADLARRAPDPR